MYDVSKYSAQAWTNLGEHVRRRRTAKGMTQEELSEAAQVSINTIGNIEAGKRGRLLTLPKIARALGWTEDSCILVLEGKEPAMEPSAVRDDTLHIPRPPGVPDSDWAAISEKLHAEVDFWLRTRGR